MKGLKQKLNNYMTLNSITDFIIFHIKHNIVTLIM